MRPGGREGRTSVGGDEGTLPLLRNGCNGVKTVIVRAKTPELPPEVCGNTLREGGREGGREEV